MYRGAPAESFAPKLTGAAAYFFAAARSLKARPAGFSGADGVDDTGLPAWLAVEQDGLGQGRARLDFHTRFVTVVLYS
jgi:hypothetical protein